MPTQWARKRIAAAVVVFPSPARRVLSATQGYITITHIGTPTQYDPGQKACACHVHKVFLCPPRRDIETYSFIEPRDSRYSCV